MDKKSFAQGFIVALGTVTACHFGFDFAINNGLINWAALPFGVNLSVERKTKQIFQLLETQYVDPINRSFVEDSLFRGMLQGMQDPYTYYMSSEEYGKYLTNNHGSFVGIGVEITENVDNEIVIYHLLEDGVAKEAGILENDIIKKVNGISVEGMTVSEVANLLSGYTTHIKNQITLEVFCPATGETLEFLLTPREIITRSVVPELYDETIGYIHITSFKSNTYDQFAEALDQFIADDVTGLIIDLRGNLGGLVTSVYDVSELILPEGILVSTIDNSGREETLDLDDSYFDVPMVVLVNENSASASEIFAGAAKDLEAATLVGTQTYGKGLVQTSYPLSDGSAVNITVKRYYTPNGISIQGTGITPDYIVSLPTGVTLRSESDVQLQKALELLTIDD
ncbi:MAG: S41 family peptidase [Bacillota bacterium]